MTTAFLFVFFPSHDGSTFWFIGQHILLSIALYLCAYAQAWKGHEKRALALAFAGSFMSYGSPPVALGLFILSLLERRNRQAWLLWIPNLVYCAYYVVLDRMFDVPGSRLPDTLSPVSVAKQFVVQVGSYLDAVFGPSFFLKCGTSLMAINLAAIPICIAACLAFYVLARGAAWGKPTLDWKLMTSLNVVTAGSFGIFALTGAYPQIAFNVGDRTTTFGSLLAVYALMAAPMPATLRRVVVTGLLATAVGLSCHWKQWQAHQREVIGHIAGNAALGRLDGSREVFVTGNQYSKLGPFSHLEFLSQDTVADAVFRFASGNRLSARPLSRRFECRGGELVDPKWGERLRIPEEVLVCDSEADRLLRVRACDLPCYITSLPPDNRHWLQMIRSERINSLLVWLTPRLKYAF